MFWSITGLQLRVCGHPEAGAGLELPRTSLSNSPAMCRFLLIHVFSALYSFFMTKPQLFAGCQLHNILFKSSAKVTWDQVNTVPCHHGGMCWQNKARLKPWFVLCSLAITLPSLEKRYYVILFELYMTSLFLKLFHLLMCCCLIELLSLASIIYFMVGLICLHDLGWAIW